MRNRFLFSSALIVCTILFAVLLSGFFICRHLIETAPPVYVSLGVYGEVMTVEVSDTEILVTINHHGGPSEYSGTHQYRIDSSTTISTADKDALLNGSTGMLVWVEATPFRDSDFNSDENYIFSCQKFLIRQPTIPEWWDGA